MGHDHAKSTMKVFFSISLGNCLLASSFSASPKAGDVSCCCKPILLEASLEQIKDQGQHGVTAKESAVTLSGFLH